MEIIIKVDHDEMDKVKTFNTKNRERDQLIHTIKYLDDQLHYRDEMLMELQNKDSEIQDLKLENDRLKQRDDIMVNFIKSVKCTGLPCSECDFSNDSRNCMFDVGFMSEEVSKLYMIFSDKAKDILERLDNL